MRNALPPDPSTHSLSPNADQIKAITGHESLSEVVRYTKAADQARLARQAIGMMRADREQKLSSNPNRAGQNGEQVIVTQ